MGPNAVRPHPPGWRDGAGTVSPPVVSQAAGDRSQEVSSHDRYRAPYTRGATVTADDERALAELYDGLGAIARQLAQAAAGLEALARPVELVEIPGLVADATEHVGRALYIAAELRKAYA